jgi:hypothetical protein
MTGTTTALRTLHDVGLAAWFGGGLMGAIAVNSTARRAEDLSQRHRLSSHGWERWAPFNAAAVGTHLVGATGLLLADRDKLARERRDRTTALVKGGLTVGALAVTVLARRRGQVITEHLDNPSEGPDGSGAGSPGSFAHAKDQLRVLHWAVPALTGGVLVLSAAQARRSTQ